jgi:hypothetical protein
LEADSSVRCKNSHIEEENGMHSWSRHTYAITPTGRRRVSLWLVWLSHTTKGKWIGQHWDPVISSADSVFPC